MRERMSPLDPKFFDDPYMVMVRANRIWERLGSALRDDSMTREQRQDIAGMWWGFLNDALREGAAYEC